MAPLTSLANVFCKLTDTRHKRGIRYPFHAVCALVFLGMLAHITETAALRRWTIAHWNILRPALGFTREDIPVETQINRIIATISLDEFRTAAAEFINAALGDTTEPLAAAVDGKTACQSLDEEGHPEHMLNVFIQDIKVAAIQWSVSEGKTNEANCLKEHLGELCEKYPGLRVLTGDAAFLTRPLLEAMHEHGCKYLFQVKGNQKDTLDALQVAFCEENLAKEKFVSLPIEKRGALLKSGGTILI